MTNKRIYGDNLTVMRESMADESVDLIYLDPPFNTNASYGVLFREPSGERSAAQIEAFDDTWHWNDAAERAFDEIINSPHSDAAIMLRAMRSALGENDMMAYLANMGVRLIELHRVLKGTGSIYLHCDPTASHYLKIIMDSIFGPKQMLNEIIWCYKRYTAKSNRFQRLHDTILYYAKGSTHAFNEARREYGVNSGKADSHYKQDEDGYWFRWQKLKGQEPYKIYLAEGVRLGDWWEIPPINASAKERLGYPTQKPLALLERIITTSSNEGDIVLDPFCGCGTTVHAAQKLGREWLGIDVTHLAIGLVERRLRVAFPGISLEVHGVPRDHAGACNLAERDKHEFQKWIVAMIGGQPYKGGRKGMDRGIDGYLHFRDADRKAQFAVVSVKGGGTKSGDIRDLKGTVEREKAALGLFLTLNPPSREMERGAASAGLYESGGRKFARIQILTAEEILAGKMPQVPFGFTESYKNSEKEGGDDQPTLL